MKIRKLITVILILINTNSFAQYANFEYNTELCECIAKFDSTKYSRQELQNTIDYLWNSNYISTNSTPRKLEDIEKLNVTDLRKECDEKINTLKSLKIVNEPFWTKLLAEQIAFYESTCRLKEFTILAYANPKILLTYELVDSTCIYYRDALIAGGDQLIKAWYALHEKQKSNNGSPENLQRRFDNKYYSDHRLEYARMEVMSFGWWNSANHLLPHINTYYDYNEEFEKLLIDIECDCDEP
ncbi:MAG: hypothetical protein PHQ74_09895 [Crocinitomicaceae bacterium]|nr:hypothetical protein [Crocinitomicaceae bacterium]